MQGSALDFPQIDSGNGDYMALSSMTGFATSSGEKDGLHWQWEIKSVNGKALDLRCRLPSGFEALEATARSILAQHIKRGNLQVTLTLSGSVSREAIVVNEAVLEQVLAIAEKLRDRIGGVPLSAVDLMGLRGVLDVVQSTPNRGRDCSPFDRCLRLAGKGSRCPRRREACGRCQACYRDFGATRKD